MHCLYRLQEAETYHVTTLLTTASAEYGRNSQHGVRMELVELQADRLGLPLKGVWLPPNPSMEAYDECMGNALRDLKAQQVETAVFGDIFLEDVRAYRERRLEELGLQAAFPLWQKPTDELARQFIEVGFRAIVVSVDERALGRDFVGRPYDRAFLEALPEDVDPCGEHGEFHTFVYDGPSFRRPVPFDTGEVVRRTYEASGAQDVTHPCSSDGASSFEVGMWFCDLLPADTTSSDPSLHSSQEQSR